MTRSTADTRNGFVPDTCKHFVVETVKGVCPRHSIAGFRLFNLIIIISISNYLAADIKRCG